MSASASVLPAASDAEKESTALQERTVVLVKPDAYARGLTGEIIARFERKGLSLVAARVLTMTPEIADDPKPCGVCPSCRWWLPPRAI